MERHQQRRFQTNVSEVTSDSPTSKTTRVGKRVYINPALGCFPLPSQCADDTSKGRRRGKDATPRHQAGVLEHTLSECCVCQATTPPGDSTCWRLKKAMYGTLTASSEKGVGLSQGSGYPCCFSCPQTHVMLVYHGDDIVVVGPLASVLDVEAKIAERFSLVWKALLVMGRRMTDK
eukprot:4049692-Amphidinium_carterae.1